MHSNCHQSEKENRHFVVLRRSADHNPHKSEGALVCLGLIHLSLAGIAGFPYWLTLLLPMFLLGARLQAAVDSTVAGLIWGLGRLLVEVIPPEVSPLPHSQHNRSLFCFPFGPAPVDRFWNCSTFSKSCCIVFMRVVKAFSVGLRISSFSSSSICQTLVLPYSFLSLICRNSFLVLMVSSSHYI